MDATWGSRELPVLEAIISGLDSVAADGGWPDGADIDARTGLPLADVGTALLALDGHYITLVRSGTAAGLAETPQPPRAASPPQRACTATKPERT